MPLGAPTSVQTTAITAIWTAARPTALRTSTSGRAQYVQRVEDRRAEDQHHPQTAQTPAGKGMRVQRSQQHGDPDGPGDPLAEDHGRQQWRQHHVHTGDEARHGRGRPLDSRGLEDLCDSVDEPEDRAVTPFLAGQPTDVAEPTAKRNTAAIAKRTARKSTTDISSRTSLIMKNVEPQAAVTPIRASVGRRRSARALGSAGSPGNSTALPAGRRGQISHRRSAGTSGMSPPPA